MPAGLYFRHASSLQHETGAHPENKARIPAIEHELARRGWVGWEPREAPAVETAQLERIHPAEHIEHIRAMSAGGQIDVRFTVLSALDMTFSAGTAVRVADGVAPSGEFMVSLRVLR